MAAIRTKGTTCRPPIEVRGDEQPGEIHCTPFAESILGFTVANV
jgi:hypothetical protein